MSSIDPSIVKKIGLSGKDTVEKMLDILKSHDLSLKYDNQTQTFTVIGSSKIKKEEIEKIFAEKKYYGRQPSVLNSTDSLGNRIIRLEPITSESSQKASRVYQKSFQGSGDFRDDEATQLVSNIQSLGISFEHPKCIDIGCRSGENALAMQKAGAQVVGIDPDDTEFSTAKKKGLKETQLFPLTLQEYYERFPDQKFDVATVFLWNIPRSEYSSFAKTLAHIIHPDGFAIIGYADEPYDKDPEINVPKLMNSFFKGVQRFTFPGSLNRYMLICSNPKLEEFTDLQ